VTGSFFPTDPPQFQSIPFAYRFGAIKNSLIDAGFTNISAVVLRLQKEVPDLAVLARGLVFGSPIIDQVQQRGGVDAEEVVDAIVSEYRNQFGSDGLRSRSKQSFFLPRSRPAHIRTILPREHETLTGVPTPNDRNIRCGCFLFALHIGN